MTLQPKHEPSLSRPDTGFGATAAMAPTVADHMVQILLRTITALVRRDGADLTARQIAAFLICYLDSEAQTVRGLAANLKVGSPDMTRVLDRLCEFDLVRRKTNPLDRRGILLQRTATGEAFLSEVKAMLAEADRAITVAREKS